MAGLERGEVFLTGRIGEVLGQLFLRVVPWNISVADKIGKSNSGNRANSLTFPNESIPWESHGQFDPQAR